MSDLTYSVHRLRSLGSELSHLAGDVDADARVLGHYTEHDLAHRDVVRALHDFTDDWHDRRADLVGRLADLGARAADSAAVLSETDAALAREALLVTDGRLA